MNQLMTLHKRSLRFHPDQPVFPSADARLSVLLCVNNVCSILQQTDQMLLHLVWCSLHEKRWATKEEKFRFPYVCVATIPGEKKLHTWYMCWAHNHITCACLIYTHKSATYTILEFGKKDILLSLSLQLRKQIELMRYDKKFTSVQIKNGLILNAWKLEVFSRHK